MDKKKEPWYESEDPDRVSRALGLRFGIAVVGVLAFFAVVGVGVWAVKVAVSDVKGQGDAVQIKNDARNRIRAQEGFEKLYQDIKASDLKIDVLDQAAQTSPEDPTAKLNASGQRLHCVGLVGEYNAKARQFSQADFRSADLPLEISSADSSTDCKGSGGS